MTAKPLSLKKKIARYLRKHLVPKGYASRDLFEELLAQAARTLSLNELLVIYPSNICSALQLSSFHMAKQRKLPPVKSSPPAARSSFA